MQDLLVTILAMFAYTYGAAMPIEASLPPIQGAWPLLASLPALGILMGYFAGRRLPRLRALAAPVPAGAYAARVFRLAPLLLAIPFFYAIHEYAWATQVRRFIPPQIPLLPAIVTLSPFLLACGGFALAFTARFHSPNARLGTLPARLQLELRLLFLPLLPFLFTILILDLGWHFPDVRLWLAVSPYASTLGLGMLLVAGLVFSPFAVRLFWPSSPFPDGAVLGRMHELARMASVRCRDIRIWHTLHRSVANACIAGVIGRVRYIFFTDALIVRLDPLELLGVFAHELAHARLRHFVIYGVFGATLLFALAGVDSILPDDPARAWAILLGGCAAYGWLFFGAMSRQLESHADLFAASLLGSSQLFVQVLERISELGGRSRDKPGWRHHSIAKRVRILRAADEDANFRRAFERRTTLFIAALGALFVGAILLWGSGVRALSALPLYEKERQVAVALRQERVERALRPWPDTDRMFVLGSRGVQHAEAALAAARQEPMDDGALRQLLEDCAPWVVEAGDSEPNLRRLAEDALRRLQREQQQK